MQKSVIESQKKVYLGGESMNKKHIYTENRNVSYEIEPWKTE